MLYPVPQKDGATGEELSKGDDTAIDEFKDKHHTAIHGQGPHEVHGDHVAPYSRELQGDFGSGKQEVL